MANHLGSRLLQIALVGLVGCRPSPPDAPDVTVSERADTTFVRIAAGVDTAASVVPVAEVLWRDAALGRPTSMALVGDRLFIGDGDRLHVVSRRSGTHVRSIGQSGQGPEEFGYIAGVGGLEGRVVALDARNVRLTVLDTAGTVRATHRLEWPLPFVNPRGRGAQLRLWADGVLWVGEEFVRRDRRTRSALVTYEPGAGAPRVLQEYDHRLWVEFGEVLFPAEAFSAETRIAVSADGRVAWGDGLEYCVSFRRLGQSAVTRACRDRPRAPLTSGVRRASIAGLDLDPRFAPSYQAAVEGQQLGDSFPSFDRLEFGEDGRLWVRTVGREAPDIHPTLRGRIPDPLPWPRRWEAYDSEGRPAGAVVLPDGFDPRVFLDGEAFGFSRLPSGEIAVARVDW